MDGWTDKQTGRQMTDDKQADRQTDIWTDRQTDYGWTGRQASERWAN